MNTLRRSACHCCGYLTLPEAHGSPDEICPVCFWQDDDLSNRRLDEAIGPNKVSLREARRNYAAFGASEPRLLPSVRAPLSDERSPGDGVDLSHFR